MKKLFTLMAAALMAAGVQAQTLFDFSKSPDDITVSGTTAMGTVKINENKTSVSGIQFKNSYKTDNALNDNYAVLTVDGGFKAGDVVTIAGAYNNTAEKNAAVDIFTVDDASAVTVLFTTQNFINGRLVADEPVEETYTLTADADKLYFGRNGNTGTFITTLKVVRGEEKPSDPTPATVWNFQQELSANDAANLAADAANWTFDEDNNYWKNAAVLADKNVFTALKANGTELEFAKGITFARDNSEGLGADRVRISSGKYLAVNGSKISLNFGTLVKDDVVRIKFKAGGVSDRSFTVSNTELVSGLMQTTDTEEHEVELKVSKDNAVTLTTTNGYQFLVITVNQTLEEVATAIQGVKTANAESGAIYNLAGQKVSEGFKGIAIKNGKKVVLK